ncbi:lipid catabolic process [Musa troglodytarum]|uniref:Lipid catabolic process n=1 Tax=Musa troglodytarum TaxID=320322 RepID=A0A9E7JFG2_9LILI|nr:lipid catabolic process [Musa troglodytarum]
MAFNANLLLVTAFLCLLSVHHGSACFPAIFSFGDSLQDTGNFINTFANTTISKLPWGITYFHKATGRYSDGRLIIDFIAQALGLPLVPPYQGGRNFSRGANFAFGGATAQDLNTLAGLGLNVTGIMNMPLQVQIDWFQDLLKSVPSLAAPDRTFLGNSLFIMGEIGGNDFNAALSQDKPIENIKDAFVPGVVRTISSGITTLIALGAKNFIVPGNLPIGCVPAWLSKYKRSGPGYYDANGCIIWLNDFSQYYASKLQDELNKLKRDHREANIYYADYYGAGMRLFSDPKQFGITERFVACCGGNGHGCDETGPVCSNPLAYASWEGFHPTEAFYHAVSDGLIRGPFAIPLLNQTCLNHARNTAGTLHY